MAILEKTLILFLFILAIAAKTVISQNCVETGCSGLKECCSSSGYCGTRVDQCGFRCVGGLCDLSRRPNSTLLHVNAGPRDKIESIVTPALFKHIMSNVGSNCPAKGFYTHEAFIDAVKMFKPYRGMVAKREVAAILAHFSHGSIGFCYKEDNTLESYCSKNKMYPCQPGKKYYGRGLLQSVRWNEFYGAAGKFLGFPLLKDPDMVTRNPKVAFKFAMWFWNMNVRPALTYGFGVVSKRVDGRICSNLHRGDKKSVDKKYAEFCKILGVTIDEGHFCY